jgi:RNA polymerase sigma-70 factor (ECF subfamily)
MPFRRGRFRLDGQALASLFYSHSSDILAYLLRRTFDRDVALDLLAETYAQAFVDRGAFRGATREAAVGWLYGIARHQASGYYRRGHAERRALERLGIEPPRWQDPDIERFEELAGLQSLRVAVAREVANLSTGQQRALELRIVGEETYADIATELGVSEETVRARVSRALRTLAAELSADDDHRGAPRESLR